MSWDQIVPRLRRGARLTFDQVRGQDALLHPEGVTMLNTTAAAVLSLIDGQTSVPGITEELTSRYQGVRAADVTELLRSMEAARLIELLPAHRRSVAGASAGRAELPAGEASATAGGASQRNGPQLPFGLLAELTHRCPLHCPYCSNPLEMTTAAGELPTSAWLDVIGQARRLGVLQVHLSGGEPLLRRDLEAIAAHARSLDMYVNLVTSGVGLSATRAEALMAAGVDHVQLSLQGAHVARADRIAGARAHERKLEAAGAIRAAGLALTINVVLHRANVSDIDALVELAVRLDAGRLELAHAQYYGWALRNRAWLLPTASQVERADAAVSAARLRYPQLEIIYVACDYHERTPKPCMNGWGMRQMTITPAGTVLPCPAATVIGDLNPPSVSAAPLSLIWFESQAFTRFRGVSWLPEPCHSCPAREDDFGGCRCQAYQLLGDAGATDPVCQYSPRRPVIDAALTAAASGAWPAPVYRAFPPARNMNSTCG